MSLSLLAYVYLRGGKSLPSGLSGLGQFFLCSLNVCLSRVDSVLLRRITVDSMVPEGAAVGLLAGGCDKPLAGASIPNTCSTICLRSMA